MTFCQKMPTFGTFLSTILRYGDCHTGTGTSHGVLELETRVCRMHNWVLCALNGPKRSSVGRDMVICLNAALMTRRLKKVCSGFDRVSFWHKLLCAWPLAEWNIQQKFFSSVSGCVCRTLSACLYILVRRNWKSVQQKKRGHLERSPSQLNHICGVAVMCLWNSNVTFYFYWELNIVDNILVSC